MMGTRQNAADELAARLKGVADELAGNGVRPKRLPYGPARSAGLFRRRAPKGFLLYAVGQRLVVLLPDGRLWLYHERRNIEGIFYDARTDHGRSMHGSIPMDTGRFNYLGAVIGKYHFGYRQDDAAEGTNSYELGAMVSRDGAAASYLKADEAFDAIVDNLESL